MHSDHFPYPVGLLLFNRPEYSIQLLRALQEQTCKPDEIYIHVDGYSGSRDQEEGRPNFQNLTLRYIQEEFPKAKITIEERNLGIARSWNSLEQVVFDSTLASAAQFFESDFLPSKHYLELIKKLFEEIGHHQTIASLSLVGAHKNYGFKRESLVNSWGTKAVFLKRSHYEERMPFILQYLKLMEGIPYGQRDSEKILSYFQDMGIYLNGTSQDHFKIGMLEHFNRLQLSTHESYGKDLGRFGFSRKISKELDDLSKMNIDSDFGTPPKDIKIRFNAAILLRDFKLGFFSAILEKQHFLPVKLKLTYRVLILIRLYFKKFKFLNMIVGVLRRFERNIRAL